MTTEDAKYLVALYDSAHVLLDLAESANLLNIKHQTVCYISGTLRCVCGLNRIATHLETLGQVSR